MRKITVSTFKQITNLQKNSTEVLILPNWTYLTYQSGYVISCCSFTGSQANILRIYEQHEAKLISQHQIDRSFKILKVCIVGRVLGIIGVELSGFYVGRVGQPKLLSIQAHIADILQVIPFEEQYFYTASKDMTIRKWQIIKESTQISKQLVKFPKALIYHKGTVKTLAFYHRFLISGSQDKSITVWHDDKVWSSLFFSTTVFKVTPLTSSQQIVVATDDSTLHFIKISSILSKNIRVQATLNVKQLSSSLHFSEINESFSVLKTFDSLKFIQVNLRIVIHSLPSQFQSKTETEPQKIDGVWSKGTYFLYSKLGSGLWAVKL